MIWLLQEEESRMCILSASASSNKNLLVDLGGPNVDNGHNAVIIVHIVNHTKGLYKENS